MRVEVKLVNGDIITGELATPVVAGNKSISIVRDYEWCSEDGGGQYTYGTIRIPMRSVLWFIESPDSSHGKEGFNICYDNNFAKNSSVQPKNIVI